MNGWDIEIENIAGIRAGEATIQPGVNTVQAENWQGKSSFIAAIETAMGTARPLTEGTTAGSVSLETDDEAIAVELVRTDDGVRVDGRPFLEEEYDRVCAALYAFLDGTNDVRGAVRRGENLEAVLTRPLDFENLDERIAALQRERDQVTSELERAREAADDLQAAQETVSELEADLERLRERRAGLDHSADAGGDEGAREELSDARAERDRSDARIERLEASLGRAEERLAERRETLDALDAVDGESVSDELAAEREALAGVEQDIELLQSAYAGAKRLLEEDRFDLLAGVEHGVMGDTVTCLLCGNDVDRDAFADHLDGIGDRVAALREDAEAHREQIESLEVSQAAIEERRRRRTDLEDEIASLEETVGERRESMTGARERRADLESRLADLAETVESLDSELTDVESDIKYLEAEVAEARGERESLADLAANRDRLERERESLADDIESLRTRKDRMKRRAREAFDEAVADLLDRFDTGFETARLTSSFDLVVARDGREASLDALSEGELELIGLVAALAGHQSFEVGETAPLMLLDDLGGLSDDSLHTVVGMFREHVDRLVLTAYPEHSAFEGHQIDPSEWSVVSDQTEAPARS
jgi:DNA repair exonuclease SbcCD ATPase subunit